MREMEEIQCGCGSPKDPGYDTCYECYVSEHCTTQGRKGEGHVNTCSKCGKIIKAEYTTCYKCFKNH